MIVWAGQIHAKARDTLIQLKYEGWRFTRRAKNRILRTGRPLCGRTFRPVPVSGMDYLLRSRNRDALIREVCSACERFGYLLEPSRVMLQRGAHPLYPAWSDLHEAWLYALDSHATAGLHLLYRDLLTLMGREDRSLKEWMTFLQRQGLQPLDADEEQVSISPLVRRRYENCLHLEDGESCPIEAHPWVLDRKMVISGRLKR